MKGMSICVLFTVFCLLCFTTPAVSAGQTDREKIVKEYEAADVNKDGYVDENEYKRFVSKEYEAKEKKEKKKDGVEKNESGQREREEFVTAGEEKTPKITFKEFLNGRLRFFNQADANKDNLLSLEEFTQMMIIDPVR